METSPPFRDTPASIEQIPQDDSQTDPSPGETDRFTLTTTGAISKIGLDSSAGDFPEASGGSPDVESGEISGLQGLGFAFPGTRPRVEKNPKNWRAITVATVMGVVAFGAVAGAVHVRGEHPNTSLEDGAGPAAAGRAASVRPSHPKGLAGQHTAKVTVLESKPTQAPQTVLPSPTPETTSPSTSAAKPSAEQLAAAEALKAIASLPLATRAQLLLAVSEPALASAPKGSDVVNPFVGDEFKNVGSIITEGIPGAKELAELAKFKSSGYAPEVTFNFAEAGLMPAAFAPGATQPALAAELAKIKKAGADAFILPINLDYSDATDASQTVQQTKLLSGPELTAHIKSIVAAAKQAGLRVILNGYMSEAPASGLGANSMLKSPKGRYYDTSLRNARVVTGGLANSGAGMIISTVQVPDSVNVGHTPYRAAALNTYPYNQMDYTYNEDPTYAAGLNAFQQAHPQRPSRKDLDLAYYAYIAVHSGADYVIYAQPEKTGTPGQGDTNINAKTIGAFVKVIVSGVKSGDISEINLNHKVLANLLARTGGNYTEVEQAVGQIKTGEAATPAKPTTSAAASTVAPSPPPKSSPSSTPTPTSGK